VKRGSFSPDWLQRRLVMLLPSYPAVSLCVALSGGVDSVALLAALAARSRKRTRLRAVHVHHGLHANADQWSVHCSALAKQLGVPLSTLRVKVPRTRGASVEAAARDTRYEALAAELAPDEVLLTAHHEDDQLETILLQLMRGAGIPGLAAMPAAAPFARGTLARPLLTRSRAELEAWARANDLTWVEDDTNANEQFDRNYLRRRVLPLIRERWPGAAHAASRSARHVAEAKGLLDALALADVERASNGPSLSVQALRALAPDRRRNAVRYWIARAGYTVPDTTRLDEITRTLLDARPDANPAVEWNGTQVLRHADHLTLGPAPRRAPRTANNGTRESLGSPDEVERAIATPPSSPTRNLARLPRGATGTVASSATSPPNEAIPWNWRALSQLQLSDSRGTLEIVRDPHGPLDLDTLPETLTIRRRQGGERLRPQRSARTKTLKSLLQQSRIPLADRPHLPLIFNDDQLIAVADRWLDHSIQATPTSQSRARLHWHRNAR
jgi:tRNA(Ile)-lysidine synthase